MSHRASVLAAHLSQDAASQHRQTTVSNTAALKRRQQRDTIEPAKHIGYGKVILFGEHVVVYKLPAVVCAVKEYTDCTVRRTPGSPGLTLTDNRPAVPGYKVAKRGEQEAAHDLVIKHLNLDLSTDGIHVTLAGPLVPTSGIGASASDVCALTRALSDAFGLGLSETDVNYSAWVGEGGYHGTPSGIDNTAATYGGLLSFQRTETPGQPNFQSITVPTPGRLVVVSTGITASTSKVVAEVRRAKEADPQWWARIASRYQSLYDHAYVALQKGDWPTVGSLMDENHILCRDELRLSIPELETIVGAMKAAGALGAKLSGTGRGGLAIALCDTEELQAHVAGALRRIPEAKFVWEYSI